MSEPGSHDFVVRDSRTVYDGAILALRVDQVEMPGGGSPNVRWSNTMARSRSWRSTMPVAWRWCASTGIRSGAGCWNYPAGLFRRRTRRGPADGGAARTRRRSGSGGRLLAGTHRPGAVPGFTDEALRVYLAESLHSLNPAERHDEEADMAVEWVSATPSPRSCPGRS